MTFSEIKSHFWRLLGGTSNSTGFSNTTVLAWANMALRDLVDSSKCLERRQAMVLTAGTAKYDLPSDCKQVMRAHYDGDALAKTTLLEVQQKTWSWETDSGTPAWYYVDGLNDQVGLYPVPTTSTTTDESDSKFGFKVASTGVGFVIDTADAERLPDKMGFLYQEITAFELEVYYTCRPPALVLDADTPQIPAWAHPLIVYGMLKYALKANTHLRDMERAAFWAGMYEAGKRRLFERSASKLPHEWIIKARTWGYRPRIRRLPDTITP